MSLLDGGPPQSWPGTELGSTDAMLLLAKVSGALAGSLISVAYVLPRGRREAFIRLGVGVVTGLVFGGTAGMKIADMLGLLDKISLFEITLVGAATASLCAWWALGALKRVADRMPSRVDPAKSAKEGRNT